MEYIHVCMYVIFPRWRLEVHLGLIRILLGLEIAKRTLFTSCSWKRGGRFPFQWTSQNFGELKATKQIYRQTSGDEVLDFVGATYVHHANQNEDYANPTQKYRVMTTNGSSQIWLWEMHILTMIIWFPHIILGYRRIRSH